MIHKKLAERYSNILSALKLIKIYNFLIYALAISAIFFLEGPIVLLMCIVTINKLVNTFFLKKLISYLETLNSLFPKDSLDNFKTI